MGKRGKKSLLHTPAELVLPNSLSTSHGCQSPQMHRLGPIGTGGYLNKLSLPLPLRSRNSGAIFATACQHAQSSCVYFQAGLALFKSVVAGIRCFFPQTEGDQPLCRRGAGQWDLCCLQSCPCPADVLLLLCYWTSS